MTASQIIDSMTAQNEHVQASIRSLQAMQSCPSAAVSLGMLNAYRHFPTPRKDALEAEKQRPWTDKERQRFMAAGGLQ